MKKLQVKAVPGDHGLGIDDKQGTLPAGPERPEGDPEGAIPVRSRPRLRAR